ncbi:MAG: ABC transporter permease [Pyrinomonadaceae bacterium]
MRKFFAVVRHEYKKVVLKWSFLIATLLLPFLAACFAIVPAVIFSIKGEPTRIAIVDPAGKIGPRLKANLSSDKMLAKAKRAAEDSAKFSTSQSDRMEQSSKQFVESFIFVDYPPDANTGDELRRDLNEKILHGDIEAYLIIPRDIYAAGATFEYRSRKAGDIMSGETFRDALNDAVRSQRLADANISEEKLDQLSSDVELDAKGINEKGEEKDTSGVMVASFIIGLMIYITLAIYGQAIMGAVVEEKETRIAEILFSSARPFELMLGKLVGVGLAGLTQLAIWIGTATVLIGLLAARLGGEDIVDSIPSISPLMILYFLIFFLLGFFIYASIFALIGSMVTTVQEGGQFAFPPIMILLIGFYLSFAVIRDPNSSLSFWASIAPFFAPITMPVRILAEMPPLWQIALSMLINAVAIVFLVWLTSRVYRVGMLMYGKRATIPEVWKWIRQA